MRPWYVQLTVPRPVLHARIQQRVADMLAAGLVAEVEAVLASGVPADARGLDGVGYREVVQCLQGQLSREELATAIERSTRRYAKRQETWFRHQLGEAPMVTLDATERPAVLAERLFHFWQGRGG